MLKVGLRVGPSGHRVLVPVPVDEPHPPEFVAVLQQHRDGALGYGHHGVNPVGVPEASHPVTGVGMRVQGALHDLYVLEGDLEEEQYAVQPQDRVAQLRWIGVCCPGGDA